MNGCLCLWFQVSWNSRHQLTLLERVIDKVLYVGGGHCGGASSYTHVPGKQHSLEALVEWVEQKKDPEALLGTSPADGSERTRKLCRWPRTAKLVGADADNWESFVCD